MIRVHRLIDAEAESIVVLSEQGYECGRPSLIRTHARVVDGQIEHLSVGGTARRSMVGRIHLPEEWARQSTASKSA